MSTLSTFERSLPPAKAWRNAARENATARPIEAAKMAARIAWSVLVGHSSGQRIGMSSYSAARRSTSAMPASRSSVTAHDCPPVSFQIPPSRIGCQTGTTGSTLCDAAPPSDTRRATRGRNRRPAAQSRALVARQSDAAEGVLNRQVHPVAADVAAAGQHERLELVERRPACRVKVDARGPLAARSSAGLETGESGPVGALSEAHAPRCRRCWTAPKKPLGGPRVLARCTLPALRPCRGGTGRGALGRCSPPTRSASAARGTWPSALSFTTPPPRLFGLTSRARSVRSRMSLLRRLLFRTSPLRRLLSTTSALSTWITAYEVPPSAMNSATVAVTLEYDRCFRSEVSMFGRALAEVRRILAGGLEPGRPP